jgi:hypothetical protein
MTSSTDELLPPGNDDLAIVFVHGFLDDRHTWNGVVNQLVSGVEMIRVDLYGCGEQADASGPFGCDRLAAEVGASATACLRDGSRHVERDRQQPLRRRCHGRVRAPRGQSTVSAPSSFWGWSSGRSGGGW